MTRQRKASCIILVLGMALSAAWLLAGSEPSAHLELSTYFGGSDLDSITAVRVDPNGNIYMAGSTRSTDLLTTGSLAPPPRDRATVGFLTKLRPDRTIAYSTYLERPVVALEIDAGGNAIVADNLPASTKFTGPIGDAVVTKIDATGSTVVYSVRLAGSRLDEVAAIAVDSTGAVVITGQTNSPDFPILNALQPTVPSTGSAYAAGAFITKLDAEGRMIFSTGWGGSGEDAGRSVAIDRSSDIVVAGTTASTDFVTSSGAFQRTLASTQCSVNAVPCRDAFVTRLSPDGQTIRYSTLLGGTNGETVQALALDAAGSPHLAGVTASPDLPLRQALQTSCDSSRLVTGCSAYVTKLSSDGSSLQYSTYFGSLSYYVYGPGQTINGLSVDASGNLVAVGTTQGNDLPLVRAFQSINGSGPLFKSSDDGATWSPSGSGIAGTGVWYMTTAGRRSPIYATPLGGRLFRSEDHGGRWLGRQPEGSPEPGAFAVDTLTPSVVYATSTSGLLKSTNGGDSWSRLPLDEVSLMGVVVAQSSPSNVYVLARRGIFHSPNGGVTWSLILDTHRTDGATWPYVQDIAVHPQNADTVYAMSSDGTITRRDGGHWRALASLQCPANQLLFSGDLSSTMYARSCGKVLKSIDEGRSWREVGFADRTAAWIALDPSMPHAVYVASAHNGVYRSQDRGDTWTRIREPLNQDIRSILVDPLVPGTIYIGATGASNAFVARLSPAGTLTLASYLGGLMASGTSITVDRNGAIIVAGAAGADFPLVQHVQKRYAGAGDAFVARIVDRE